MTTFNTSTRTCLMAAVVALAVGGAGCAADPSDPPVNQEQMTRVQGTVNLDDTAAAKVVRASGAIDASASYANSVVAFKVTATGELEAIAKGDLSIDGSFSFEVGIDVDLHGAIVVAFDASGQITATGICGNPDGEGEGDGDGGFTIDLDLETSVEVEVLLELAVMGAVDIDISGLCAHINAALAIAVSISVDVDIEISFLAAAVAKLQGFDLQP